MATQLINLPDVERLSPSVIRILGGNPGKVSNPLHPVRGQALTSAVQFTLQGTNTYVLGTGPRRILIDTGEGKPAWIKALIDTLESEKAEVETAVITHWHHDHTGGIQDLVTFSPKTKIYKHQPSQGLLDIHDGQHFQVQGAKIRSLFSPGHTNDHMAFVLQEEDAMFTGDNVLGHGTAVFENLALYLSSLDNMKDHFKGRAYPGHGAAIEDGPSKIIEYIRHRQQREDQVLQVLKSSTSSPGIEISEGEPEAWASMDIVKVIYKDVPETLHLPAHGGVMQILWKLQAEDKVSEIPETSRWLIRNRAVL
ncbi:putative metallo-beta-lactamase protein [Coleophoma cylindrospora]|uniref:Putative metallo-beta-lactamase protein n=1 Tax=Coleophoma cylindrospora TaxID=1849047 RepID=A0A3D8R1N2_9HELO|nr:putative metallo-beta-lactamase protein [Coleophoma cylindrospora]